MAETRLEQLLRFYREDPNDPFSVYGLALEYQKTDVRESERFFDELLGKFPDYLPAYYHAAKLKFIVVEYCLLKSRMNGRLLKN
jgi:lipoprotein NlpI